MKKIAFLFYLFIKVNCFAQTTATDTIPFDSTIVVSVLGNEKSLTETQLDTGFFIQARNPAIKIVRFSLSYFTDLSTGPGLREIPFKGNRAFIDKEYPRMYYETALGGGRVMIEFIVVEKNGRQYSVKPFIVPVKMKPRTLKQLRISSNGFTKVERQLLCFPYDHFCLKRIS